MPGFLDKIIGGGLKGLADGARDIIHEINAPKEEKEKAALAIQELATKHTEIMQQDATHQMELVLADKQSARDMYKANSSLQKVYALTYLAIYVILSCIILYEIFTPVALNIPSWGVQFIATLFGGMTMKLGTITDFLFGSGMESKKA